MYRAVFSRRAERAFVALPESQARRLKEAIERLMQEPRGHGTIKLEHAPVAQYRRRVGDLRILFDIDDDTQRAFDLLSARLPRYYAFAYDVAGCCLYGPPERCAAGARALLDAGVRTLIFSPVSDVRRQRQLLATKVVPLLG